MKISPLPPQSHPQWGDLSKVRMELPYTLPGTLCALDKPSFLHLVSSANELGKHLYGISDFYVRDFQKFRFPCFIWSPMENPFRKKKKKKQCVFYG